MQNDLLEAISREGFKAVLTDSGDAAILCLIISGMTCGFCSNTIEAALNSTGGISRAAVNLVTATAKVRPSCRHTHLGP